MNSAPCSGALSTWMKPPLWFTIPSTVDRPRPVPLPTTFRVKNGSKRRSFVSSSMPRPVSRIVIVTNWPARAPAPSVAAAASVNVTFAVAIVSVPPRGISSRELTTRLTITWCSWLGSASTDASVEPYAVTTLMSSPIRRRNIVSMSPTTSLRFSTCGSRICLRLKARSWRVRPCARSAALRISPMSAVMPGWRSPTSLARRSA